MLHNKKLKTFITMTMLCVSSIYFLFNLVLGQKGIIKLIELNKSVTSASNELSKLHVDKNRIEKRIALLNAEDLDLLDEEVRKVLGYSDKKEVVIYQ